MLDQLSGAFAGRKADGEPGISATGSGIAVAGDTAAAAGEPGGEAAFPAFSTSRCASFASRAAFISLTDMERPRPRLRPERPDVAAGDLAAEPAVGDTVGEVNGDATNPMAAFSIFSASRCASFASRSAFISLTDIERPSPRPRPERRELPDVVAGDFVGETAAEPTLGDAPGEDNGEEIIPVAAFSASRCASFASRSAFMSLTDIERPRPRPRPERPARPDAAAGDFVGETATDPALGDALGDDNGDVTIPAAAFSASRFASLASRSAFISLTDIERPRARPRAGMLVHANLRLEHRDGR